jgi:hypothetical protein
MPVFVSDEDTWPLLLSWLNLDLGPILQVCFYNGMDRYAKEWLQFLFPLYIWSIIIVIIIACRFSVKFSKLVGGNVVPVLATLFLLAYTKILTTIVNVMNKRTLTLHCDSYEYLITVWNEDPSYEYLDEYHIWLFIFSLLFLVVFCIPYTLFLLFYPFFEKYMSKYKICSIWNKMKPILDAYGGPMKDQYRFWPGLLLVARVPVILAVTLTDSTAEYQSQLLSVLLAVLIILLMFHQVYKKMLHDIIKKWFLFLLTLMTLVALVHPGAGWYHACQIIFMCTVIAILVYHVYMRLDGKFDMTSKIKAKFAKLRKRKRETEEELDGISSASFDLDRHESFIHLYESCNTTDYIHCPVVDAGDIN